MSPEQDEFREDEEHEDYASRSIFSAGWFRAVLVLTVLAIVLVVSLPYLLDWFEPTPSSISKKETRQAAEPPGPARSAETPSTLVPAPPTSQPQGQAATGGATSGRPKPGVEKPAASQPPASEPTRPAPGTFKPAPAKRIEVARHSEAAAAPLSKAATAASRGGGGYWVQVGLFKDPRNAESLAKILREEGLPVQVAQVTRGPGGAPRSGKEDGGPTATYTLVRAGAFNDRAGAMAARDKLQARGHPGFLTQGAAK